MTQKSNSYCPLQHRHLMNPFKRHQLNLWEFTSVFWGDGEASNNVGGRWKDEGTSRGRHVRRVVVQPTWAGRWRWRFSHPHGNIRSTSTFELVQPVGKEYDYYSFHYSNGLFVTASSTDLLKWSRHLISTTNCNNYLIHCFHLCRVSEAKTGLCIATISNLTLSSSPFRSVNYLT